GGYRARRPSAQSGATSQPINCPEGQALDGTGVCVQAEIGQNVFIYNGPAIEPSYQPTPYVPRPRIEYNIVYVHTPEQPAGPDPIVIPPPKQRYIVYVLTKIGQQGQQVIQVPAGPNQEPEVYYVNYNDGDNPTIGGNSLQDILAQQGQQGEFVSGGSGGFGAGGSGEIGGFGAGGSGRYGY
ncbi:UNVERIFIED_CONTAM: hypothetical protein GTU68_012865, partial [Idotea baltica]|nr:hypothetical protein [Idotea baltica]